MINVVRTILRKSCTSPTSNSTVGTFWLRISSPSSLKLNLIRIPLYSSLRDEYSGVHNSVPPKWWFTTTLYRNRSGALTWQWLHHWKALNGLYTFLVLLFKKTEVHEKSRFYSTSLYTVHHHQTCKLNKYGNNHRLVQEGILMRCQ